MDTEIPNKSVQVKEIREALSAGELTIAESTLAGLNAHSLDQATAAVTGCMT